MPLPFLGKRIPFELAEPGVDPTRLPNPHPDRSFREVVPWVLAGVALLVFGYFKFVRKPTPRQQARPAATATATVVPATVSSGGFLADGGSGGFLEVPQPPTAPAADSPTPTPTPTPATDPTATSIPSSTVTYGVFVGNLLDQQQIICTCSLDGSVSGPPECSEAVPVACGGDR